MNQRRDYIFNTIAGLINASEAVIMMMLVTRCASLTDAGYLTMAFALGNLLMTIGKYGVYGFQVSDTSHLYGYRAYFTLRIITVVLMLLSLLTYLAYGHSILDYHTDKTLTILLISLVYSIECIEDLYIGFLQCIGRLYLGSLLFIVRWIVILISFAISILCTHNIVFSLGVSFVLSLIETGIFVYVLGRRGYFAVIKGVIGNDSHTPASILNLMFVTFPLFLSSFLSFFISNASKYALERFASPERLACYGFVAMPVFAIGLLNSFVYHPQIVSLAVDYSQNRTKAFIHRVRVQYMIILALTILCMGGAFVAGVPVLSWLYSIDLSQYRAELLILTLGGGFLALSGYQTVILTIMRRQNLILYGYIPIAIIAFGGTGYAVRNYSTIGAATMYLLLMILQCVEYEVFIRINHLKE